MQVGDGAKSLFTVIAGAGVQQHVATRHSRFHFDDFFRLDVEFARHGVDLIGVQRIAVGVEIGCGVLTLEALLHGAQVEKQFALGLGSSYLDHAPVLQDVFVDFGLDPVHGIAHQANALVGVEPLDGLHEAHIAFLDQVAVGQSVAEVLAGNRDYQAQVREHQLGSGLQILVVLELACEFLLFFQCEHRQAIGGSDVGIQIPQ